MAKKILTISFILFLPLIILSNNLNIKFERISIDQGLSQSNVYDILQDSQGFMWFGTEDGLNKYDGYDFTVYKHDPNNPSSISHNYIWSLYEDRSGVMWVGTWGGGLNKFDRQKDKFTHYHYDPDDSNCLTDNTIMSIIEDKNGLLWIGTMYGGLNKFEPQTGKFTHIKHNPGNPNSLSNNSIITIYEDNSGIIWIGTFGGGLNKFDQEAGQFTHYYYDPDKPYSLSSNIVVSIFEDKFGVLWVGTESAGLNRFDRDNDQFICYQHDPSDPKSLSNNKVIKLYEDEAGIFWIGTWGGGLNKFDREKEQFTHYLNDPYNPNSLSNNAINSMYEDRSKVLWIGTFGGGLNKFYREKAQFTNYSQIPDGINVLRNISVWSLYQSNFEEMNELLVGTWDRGLYIVNQNTGTISNYQHDPNDSNSLSHNTITSLFEASLTGKNILWIGTSEGLNRFNRETGQFKRYFHNPDDPNSISDNIVRSICGDKSGNIWIGTRYGGLNKLENKTSKFSRYLNDPNNPSCLNHNAVITIFDSKYSGRDILWIGTYGGLNKFDQKSEQFTHYIHDPDDPHSINNNIVRSIYEDPSGILWVGTYGGLNRFDPSTGQFSYYTEEDGLPSNVINGILEDSSSNLWLSTNNGLSKFNPKTKIFRNYDVNDGLLSNEFNIEACLKSEDGRMFFGSSNGLNIFHPDSIRDNTNIPPIMITDIQIFHKSIPIKRESLYQEDDGYQLPQHISTLDEINLSYKESIFSFEFSALDYHGPQKNQYAYMMVGVDPDWVYTDAYNRFATYTNLDPGTYIFRVKGSNNDGLWNEEGTSLKIMITPPWWRTTWAYGSYILLLVFAVATTWRAHVKRLRIKHQLEIEHLQTEKLQAVDQMKSRFFANVSHEFRTPLTLIKGPVKQMLDNEFNEKKREVYGTILRYSDRLLHLINQILDLSKLESGSMTLKVNQTDLIPFLKGIIQSFASLADYKNIFFEFNTTIESLIGYVDRDKLEKIVTNLLSNAFKFTPERGRVEVAVLNPPVSPLMHKGGIKGGSGENIEIRISNTGPGIPPDQLERIFDRFYQADHSYKKDSEGSGIGLALTKELVQVCHGEIRVESEPHKVTTFTVLMPIAKEYFKPEEFFEELETGERILETGKEVLQGEHSEDLPESRIQDQTPSIEIPEVGSDSEFRSPVSLPDVRQKASGFRSPLLLIVEDNPDMTAYISSFLEPEYRIISAENGQEGWEKALQKFPDLVISDVMMPIMDGFELCYKLKNDENISHIPVILLTAKADVDSRIEGLEFGADDYISKPFDAKELHVRVNNLIEQRKKLREKFSQTIEIQPAEITASSMDERFFKRLLDVFEQHLVESHFSTADFAREVGMSRSTLHRKLQALTNQPTHEFLRSLRLKRAAQLLKKSAGTVTEIAYAVGFNNLSYFSRVFRQQFGQSPREFTHKNQ
jgi:signal transduction histidine kinase/ligand-binding sensor domain-containing protein/CheY-like chemotaxis protein